MKNSKRKLFRKLILLEEAKSIVSEYKVSTKTIELKIENALNYVSAENIFASIDSPPFTRSEMDGYAVQAKDTIGADELKPVELNLTGRIRAENISPLILNTNETIEVATGSNLPLGSDSVIPIEDTKELGKTVQIKKSLTDFSYVLQAGKDFKKDDLLIQKGQKLDEIHISTLAAMGKNKVFVYDKLQVAVISTGYEIKPPGKTLKPGEVYDINSFSLRTKLQKQNCNPRFFGIISDDIKKLKDVISKALKTCDIILITGGSSSGPGDLAYKIFNEFSSIYLFHGILMKPGKPTGFGLIEGKPAFVLPGNPLSCYMMFDQLVSILFNNEKNNQNKKITAKLGKRHFVAKGRKEFLPINLLTWKNNNVAYPSIGSSGAITRILNSDGMIEIPKNIDILLENESVSVSLFKHYQSPDFYIFGDIDPIIQFASWHVKIQNNLIIKLINEGPSLSFKIANDFPSLVSLTTINEKPNHKNWQPLVNYTKSFGISLNKEKYDSIKNNKKISDLSITAVSRIPDHFEGKLQKLLTKNHNIKFIGYAATDHEALSLINNRTVDAAFTYKTNMNFIELIKTKTWIMGKKNNNTINNLFTNIMTSKKFRKECKCLFKWFNVI